MKNLFMVAVMSAIALPALGAQTFQAWRTASYPGIHEAWTASTGTATFGIMCFEQQQQCLYYATDGNTTCAADEQIPALANSDAGAANLTGVCTIIENGRHVLVLSPFEDVESAIERGAVLGIAIPMESGQFRVFRFSLAGSAQAIEAVKNATASGSNGLGDVEL